MACDESPVHIGLLNFYSLNNSVTFSEKCVVFFRLNIPIKLGFLLPITTQTACSTITNFLEDHGTTAIEFVCP